MSTFLEMLKSKQKELAAKKVRDNTVKLPNGKSRWRILPHWSGDLDKAFFHDFGKHFIKDFSGQVQAVYICTAKTFSKPCPICDTITKAEIGTRDENTKNLLGEAKAGQRFLVNAVRKNDKGEYENEVALLELPNGVLDEVVNLAFQFASDGVNIFSPEEGFDVIIQREGTGRKTKYKAMLAPKSTPISTDYLSRATNLDEYVQQEYEEGKTKALAAISSLSSSSTPALPRSVAAAPAAGTAIPVGGVSTATKGSDEDETDLTVSLDDIDLSDLDSIGS